MLRESQGSANVRICTGATRYCGETPLRECGLSGREKCDGDCRWLKKGTDGSLVPQCRSLVIVTLMDAVAGFNHLMLQPPRPTVHCVAAPVQAVPAMIPRLHASF